MRARLARWRVTIGFIAGFVALAVAQPTWASLRVGLVMAVAGELLRLWAAGHIEKGREITRSGPYRFVRHPLYLGSIMLGVGFAIAAASLPIALLTAVYLVLTIGAAVRTEEAVLDTRFAGEYSRYRDGQTVPVSRPFSWARAIRNREYRAVIGVTVAFLWLWLRIK